MKCVGTFDISSLVSMKMYRFALNFTLMLSISCSQEKRDSARAVDLELQDLTSRLTNLETADNLDTFLEYYDDHVISMTEYQLTLYGRENIKTFYDEIFKRQNIKKFQRQAHEFIRMNETTIEIGSFKKEYTDSRTDTLVFLNGKCWMV